MAAMRHWLHQQFPAAAVAGKTDAFVMEAVVVVADAQTDRVSALRDDA